MAIHNTGMKRRPTHPGKMLREDFLPDYGLSVAGLAEAAGVSRQSINEILRERRPVLRGTRLAGRAPCVTPTRRRQLRRVGPSTGALSARRRLPSPC